MQLDLEEARAILSRTPSVLREMLGQLPDGWLHANEGPDTWTARDVVAHLTDLEDTDWMARVRLILDHGEARAFAPVDRVAFRKRFPNDSLGELLDTFEKRRQRNLTDLAKLPVDAATLARRGTHPALGTVTLEQLLATWVVHDLTHISQIVRVMARRYDETVGPWKEYLSVLKKRE